MYMNEKDLLYKKIYFKNIRTRRFFIDRSMRGKAVTSHRTPKSAKHALC
ncbi:MAG: hypothetical protein ACXU9U_02930 [Parachlamydiaceae bacterium]